LKLFFLQTCQTYHRCNEDEEFSKKTPSNNFQTPDSIEKISWNYDCLNGIVSTTINNTTDKDALLSTTQSSNKKLTKEFLILFPILGLLIVLLFIMLGCFIISRMKGTVYKIFYSLKVFFFLLYRLANR
jgi:hypothetical protein